MPRDRPYNTDRARTLRRDQSPPETVLWSRLRDRRLSNYKFRRQQPIGPIVVDFFCAEAGLVVELDSSYHAGKQRDDAARDRLVRSLGYEIVRITASDLMRDQDAVLDHVLHQLRARESR